MGQRDLAPVEPRIGQRRLRLLLDQRQPQTRAGERGRERQAGGACPYHDDIELHGHSSGPLAERGV